MRTKRTTVNYKRILNQFWNTPAAILPEKLEEIRAFLLAKADGRGFSEDEIFYVTRAHNERCRRLHHDLGVSAPDIDAQTRHRGAIIRGKVAVVPIFGVLAQRVGLLEEFSGGISTEQIGATLDSLLADRQIKSIVLAFDSPGGSVFGIQELGDKIARATKEKRIVGLADSVAASAAYWLLTQTSEVSVTPGGQVGSIGVLAAHQDISVMEEQLGVKTTIVTSSPFKAEFAPETPLSEEARTELQSKVDHYHALFVKAVARGRGVSESTVNKSFGRGRMVTATDSVELGMSDRVATIQQVLRRLGGETAGDEAQRRIPLSAIQARARAVEIS